LALTGLTTQRCLRGYNRKRSQMLHEKKQTSQRRYNEQEVAIP
jgi:hypothetical protein